MSAWGAIAAAAADIGKTYMQRQESRDTREFNRWMYRNRHQMTVEDLKRAGLNPILSAQQGAGATPTMAAANLGSSGNPVVSALQAKQMKEQIKNVQADTEKKKEEAKTQDYLRYVVLQM